MCDDPSYTCGPRDHGPKAQTELRMATATCRPLRLRRGYVPTSAPFAPTVLRATCTMSARIVAAGSPLGQFGRQPNGGLAFRSPSARLPGYGYSSLTAGATSKSISGGLQPSRRPIGEVSGDHALI